ncbi:MAG: protein tyrosine phosphatase [Planctomycetota bacterium]|nr:MAG: protein tyrosine phosphatase [Planctomycetota bacterium]
MHVKWKILSVLVLITAVAAISACTFCNITGRDTGKGVAERPNYWARKIENPKLKNLHKVSDDLYRGAQADEEGMKELERMGIKTVINLRRYHSDDDEIKETGLRFVRFKLEASDAPDRKDVIAYLKVMNDKDNLPAFIHCMRGSDRTGMMCAIYRIVFQGWEREEAIREWTKGGFGYHSIFDDIVEYVKKADFEALKKEAGIK